MINYLAYMPHPPIMLKEIGGSECKNIAATIESQQKITSDIKSLEPETDLLIIMSPHATAGRDYIPFYLSDYYSGNLANFGRSDVFAAFNGSIEASSELIDFIGNKLDITREDYDVLDHGVIVPLFELSKTDYQKPILLLGLNMQNRQEHHKLGKLLAEYAVTRKKNIVFVGSGDMSHTLKEDGPYGYNPAGPEFDNKIIELINNNNEEEFLHINENLLENAAECGFRSLLTISGILNYPSPPAPLPQWGDPSLPLQGEGSKKLKGSVLSYEGPFGVGYLSACWHPPLSA